jgi:hypothetical protein
MIDPHSVPSPYVYPLLGLLLTGAGTLAVFACKKLWELYQHADHAFTNCLPTIQKNTEKTNEILTEYISYMKGVEEGKREAVQQVREDLKK